MGPVGRENVFEVYPQTLRSSNSSRQHSHSFRTFDSGSMYRYVPTTRGETAPETASNVSSSSVAHPLAYDEPGRTHTRRPSPRYQFSETETSRRSRRSDAPSPDSRASRGEAMAGAYCSVASSRNPLRQRSVSGYLPPPTLVLRGRSRGNFSPISSDMEDAAYDAGVEHPFSWMGAKSSVPIDLKVDLKCFYGWSVERAACELVSFLDR